MSLPSQSDSLARDRDPRLSYSECIRSDRVDGRMYTDPAVFRDEVERIFQRDWLFIAHESELAEPGEFVTRRLGPQPVLLTRDDQGEISCFTNRCPHRGAEICTRRRGLAKTFRCPYHGWTFDTTGALVGLPHPDGYGADWRREDHGLVRVPRLGNYRGFVFASLASEGPSLEQHLGGASEMIDRLCDLSPRGELSVRAGWLRHRVHANWKLLSENTCDFYHPAPTHASSPLSGALFDDATGAVNRALGDGHGEMDIRPAFASRPKRDLESFSGAQRDYIEALAKRDGVDRAIRRHLAGPPHGLVFPNLFIAGQNLFVFYPIAPGETSHHQTPVFYQGAPDELRLRHLRRFEGASGPAGLLEPDDAAVWERVQRGLEAQQPEWAIVQRGVDRETLQGSVREGRMLDETAVRGFWRHYLSRMELGE